jgi:hypothetical protein
VRPKCSEKRIVLRSVAAMQHFTPVTSTNSVCFAERWAAEQKCVAYHGYDCLRVRTLAVELGKESEVDKENKPQR